MANAPPPTMPGFAAPPPPLCSDACTHQLQRRTVLVFFTAAVITFLPAFFLRIRQSRMRRHEAVGVTRRNSSPGGRIVLSLHTARRSAAQRRLQVSGLMAQLGWVLMVFGLSPTAVRALGFPIDDIVGSSASWAATYTIGGYCLLLAILPTDARAIRTICVVDFAISLVLATAIGIGDTVSYTHLTLPTILLV